MQIDALSLSPISLSPVLLCRLSVPSVHCPTVPQQDSPFRLFLSRQIFFLKKAERETDDEGVLGKGERRGNKTTNTDTRIDAAPD